MTTAFSEWVKEEIDARGWDQTELARRSGITTAHISRLVSLGRSPGPDACLGIARAFRLPPEDVFRKAGLLPPLIIGEDKGRAIREIDEMLRYLSEEDLDVIRNLARTFYERRMP